MAPGNYKPYMAYLTTQDILRLKKMAKTTKQPAAQLIREALSSRLSSGDPYNAGFNDGLQKAIDAVAGIQASQMRFPSGRSFAELAEEEIVKYQIKEPTDEVIRTEKSMPSL